MPPISYKKFELYRPRLYSFYVWHVIIQKLFCWKTIRLVSVRQFLDCLTCPSAIVTTLVWKANWVYKGSNRGACLLDIARSSNLVPCSCCHFIRNVVRFIWYSAPFYEQLINFFKFFQFMVLLANLSVFAVCWLCNHSVRVDLSAVPCAVHFYSCYYFFQTW